MAESKLRDLSTEQSMRHNPPLVDRFHQYRKGERKKKQKGSSLNEDEVRIIKIGEDALLEFIYEKFIDNQDIYLNLDTELVSNSFYIDWDAREFVFCAYKTEGEDGEVLRLPENMDYQKLVKAIPNTTESMYSENRYKAYTKKEVEKFCK